MCGSNSLQNQAWILTAGKLPLSMQHSGLEDQLTLYNMLQAKRDEDGDLIVTRTHDMILMHHGLATLLNDVGLQVRAGCIHPQRVTDKMGGIQVAPKRAGQIHRQTFGHEQHLCWAAECQMASLQVRGLMQHRAQPESWKQFHLQDLAQDHAAFCSSISQLHCSNLTSWCLLYLPALPHWAAHLQVWPGALLLADYLLDQRSYDGCTAVELGAGPGLAGIALARQAAQVFLTGDRLLLQLPAATLLPPVQTFTRKSLLLKLAAPFRHT